MAQAEVNMLRNSPRLHVPACERMLALSEANGRVRLWFPLEQMVVELAGMKDWGYGYGYVCMSGYCSMERNR